MAKKSKRRNKQAKRRAEKRAVREDSEEASVSAADRLLKRIHREASARHDRNAYLLRLEEESAWRSEQRRRARGLDDWDEDE